VSLIEYFSEEIVCSDLSHIPSLISSITLKNIKMIDEIFTNAKRLRAITPYSFRLFFDKMEIFNPFSIRHKENFELYKPESILCLPILPCEIFYITYNNILKCPDNRCENFIDKEELEKYNENFDIGENKREINEKDDFEHILNQNKILDFADNENNENEYNYNDTFGDINTIQNNIEILGENSKNYQIPLDPEGILMLYKIYKYF